MAAELGHVIVQPDGPLCSCGIRGHLEAISSGPAIVRYVIEAIKEGRQSHLPHQLNFTAKDVALAARNGDALSMEAFMNAGKYLGIAVANLLHTFNPSLLIFGGGVSKSGDILFIPMRESMKAHVMTKSYLNDLTIRSSDLGDDVGLLGALALAHIKMDKK